MADNKIEIIASLDIPKSKHNIVGEIKQLQADLQADDNARPKLIAGLDIDKSKTLIQSQLNTIVNQANAPTIKVGIDVSSTKNISTAINEQLGKTNVTTNVTDKILNNYRKTFGIVGKEANDKLRPLFTSFENAFNTANAEKYYSVLRKIVDTTVSLATSRKPNDYNDLMKNIKSQVTDGSKIYIDSRTREDLKSMLGDANQLKSVLNSVFGGGKWTFNAGKGATSFDTLVSPELLNRCQGLADCIVEIHHQISQLKGQRISVFDGITDSQIKSFIELEIQDLLKLGLTADYVEGEWVDLTGTVNTSNQTLADSASKMSTITTAFDNTSSAVNRAEQEFRELFNVTKQGDVTGIWNKDTNGNINGFTVNVKKAKGETENFRYVLKQVGEEMQFVYAGGRGSDSGVYKLTTDIENARAKYSHLLADFKSSNNAILSGLSTPIQQFETTLNNLGKTSSINDVKNSFEALKQSASQISMYLDTTNSAFNKNTNAINHYKSMDNILKEISATFDNLAIKPNVLKNELDGVKTKFAELQTLEKTEGGYTETWAKKYQEVNLELAKVKANIQLVAKAESNSQKADKNSAYQTQLKYLNKIKEETNTIISLRNKMLSAGTGESQIYQEEITKAKKRIQYDTSQLKKKQLLTEEAQRLVNTYQQQLALLEKINNSKATEKLQKSITTAIGNLDSKKLNSTFTRNNTNPEVVQQIAKIDELKAKYQNLLSLISQPQTPESLTKLRNETLLLDRDYQLLVQSVKNFQGTLRNDKTIDVNANKIKQLRAEIQAYMNLNPKAMNMKLSGGNTVGAELNRMLTQLNDLASPELVASIDRQFKTIGKTVVSMGKEGNTAFGSLLASAKKFGTWMGLTTIISRFVRSIRSMITTVVELDTALTDLKKTFKGTEQDLQDFYSNAPSIAKELGVTTKEIIEQASAWSRLGYSTKQAAEEMSKNSAIFKTISPGMDSELATDGLISMMKAYEIGYDEVLDGIISKVNVVGNEFATENSEIVEAMMRSSSAMAAANNTLEQTIALNTASVEITRNAETTANAWKTVSMRLRGYDEETEELSDDLKTITGDIADLTKVVSNNYQGISLFTDEDKETYKSTYEIISDISKIWDELSDKSQAQLLEKIAGKRNAQVVAAAIKNFETAEKSMDAMANSAGGALKELEIAQESIVFHINEFKSTFDDLSLQIFEQESLKTAVDLGTKLLEILKEMATEGTALNTIWKASPLGSIITMLGTMTSLLKNINNLLGGGLAKGLSSITEVLGAIIEFNNPLIKFSKEVEKYNKKLEKAEKANQKLIESFNEYEEGAKSLNGELDGLEEILIDYQKLISSTDDLTTVKSELVNLQDSIIDKYGDEANGIDVVNKSLEENIRLYRERANQENKDFLAKNKIDYFDARDIVEGNTQVVSASKSNPNKYWSQKTIDNWIANGVNIKSIQELPRSSSEYMSSPKAKSVIIKTDKQGVEANKEIISQLRLMAELYSEQDGFQQEKLDLLYEEIKVRESAQVLYEDYISRQNNVDAYNEVSEATWNKLDELKSKYTELQNKVATTDSLVVMQNASTELLEVENELKSLQSVNSLVSDEVEHLFSVYENGARQVRTSTDVMEGALEAHKENFEMIEKYNNALDTLADGKSISVEDMWTFVDNDLNGDLRFLQETQEGMKVSMDEFVKSKDEYIRSIMEMTRARIQGNKAEVNRLLGEIEVLNAEVTILKGQSVNSPADIQAWTKRNQLINATNSKLKELEKSIKEDEYALSLYNNELGYSLELTQKIADNYLNAFTDQIDKITDSLENQKEALEDELETLEEQLDVLEKQKETLEETIDNYETIADYISEIVRDEADALKEQQEELENSYDERITSIEDFYDSEIEKLQEANKERERNIELEEKLLALENAKNKRVKVYNETSGSFEYRGDQDAAMTARKEVQETQANFELEDKVSKLEKTRDELVKQIEDEKASVTDSFESQIEALEEYAEKWEEISKEVTDAEKDMLAEQIFGSEWREKIKNKDTAILTKFKNNYKNYNTELNNLVTGEIASLEKSIDAKKKDIEAKQKEIDSWNDYKDKVQQAAKDIENSLNGYTALLNDIKLSESSNFAERELALKTFTEKYTGYLQQIKDMQDQISGASIGNITLDVGQIKYSSEYLATYLEAILAMRKALQESSTGYGLVNSEHDAKIAHAATAIDDELIKAIEAFKKLKGYSSGGTADRTGLAMLHGTKSSAETIFNATDSKKLYDLVHNTDNISAMLANNIMRNLNNNSNIKSISSTPTTVTNHWSFGDIVANSPVEFAKQMEKYWRMKAAESLVR